MLTKKLPHHSFSWISELELETLDLTKFDADGDTSMMLEVLAINKINNHLHMRIFVHNYKHILHFRH